MRRRLSVIKRGRGAARGQQQHRAKRQKQKARNELIAWAVGGGIVLRASWHLAPYRALKWLERHVKAAPLGDFIGEHVSEQLNRVVAGAHLFTPRAAA